MSKKNLQIKKFKNISKIFRSNSFSIILNLNLDEISHIQDANVDPWEITNGARGYNSISRHIVYVGGVAADGKTTKDTRTKEQKLALETYVKDYGCGFVCCGGEDSFALGGYRDTVIETVLPVKMELHGVNELPSFDVQAWLKTIGINQ